jgi:hypothetical protein
VPAPQIPFLIACANAQVTISIFKIQLNPGEVIHDRTEILLIKRVPFGIARSSGNAEGFLRAFLAGWSFCKRQAQ